jgi:agmatinase
MNEGDSCADSFASMREGVFLPPRAFAGLATPYSDFGRARAVIVPAPYDGTSEWRSGSRHGPQAIIDASQYLELYDMELDRETYQVGICTLPEIEPCFGGPEDMVDRVYRVIRNLVKEGKLPVMLGGEHSVTLGAVRACSEAYPRLSVLQLDAHADLRDRYLGTRYGQACVMRRILELCPISQVGIRSLSREEKQFIAEQGLTAVYIRDLTAGADYMEQLIDSLTDSVYITIDVDVLDPSVMPAVGTPEPDGMSWRQVLDVLEAVALHRSVVGFDVVEFCPSQGQDACAYLLAKLAYRLIGYAVPQEGR